MKSPPPGGPGFKENGAQIKADRSYATGEGPVGSADNSETSSAEELNSIDSPPP